MGFDQKLGIIVLSVVICLFSFKRADASNNAGNFVSMVALMQLPIYGYSVLASNYPLATGLVHGSFVAYFAATEYEPDSLGMFITFGAVSLYNIAAGIQEEPKESIKLVNWSILSVASVAASYKLFGPGKKSFSLASDGKSYALTFKMNF